MTAVLAAPLYRILASPVGDLLLTGDGVALTGLYLPGHVRGPVPEPGWRRSDATFAAVAAELAAYFAGEITDFGAPVSLRGTAFQRRVWEQLRAIPYGATVGYGALARRVGAPTAARAVGAAVGRNPVSIVVPCHRVIGSAGAVTGYAGGVERKRQLLALEARRSGMPATQRFGAPAVAPQARDATEVT